MCRTTVVLVVSACAPHRRPWSKVSSWLASSQMMISAIRGRKSRRNPVQGGRQGRRRVVGDHHDADLEIGTGPGRWAGRRLATTRHRLTPSLLPDVLGRPARGGHPLALGTTLAESCSKLAVVPATVRIRAGHPRPLTRLIGWLRRTAGGNRLGADLAWAARPLRRLHPAGDRAGNRGRAATDRAGVAVAGRGYRPPEPAQPAAAAAVALVSAVARRPSGTPAGRPRTGRTAC